MSFCSFKSRPATLANHCRINEQRNQNWHLKRPKILLNPQSQSFSQSYGSILPTSLIYIVLLTRGFSPWRPVAVMSTERGVNIVKFWIFMDHIKRTGQYKKECIAFACVLFISPGKLIPWYNWAKKWVKKKRELFPGLYMTFPKHCCVTTLSIHFPRSGILTWFPFDKPKSFKTKQF